MRHPIAYLIALTCLLAGSASTRAVADPEGKAVTIPLDQIWAYDMPGTRDVRELEPKRDIRNLTRREYIHGSLINQIKAMLLKVPKETEKAGSAFVVVGTGKEALKKAHAVFLERYKDDRKPEEPLPKDTELSLVFYSYLAGWHVQVKSVEQSQRVIRVKYQALASSAIETEDKRSSFYSISDSASPRFALIRIGKFSNGNVQVMIEQIPPVDVDNPNWKPERYVSGSFDFDVK